MNFKNEINSRFMSDRGKIETLADLMTKESESLNHRMLMIENSLSLMQEALIRIESMLPSGEGVDE
jgi:hypothetical protein